RSSYIGRAWSVTVAARRLRMPVFLVQAANDYSTVPIRELTAELTRLGRPHQTRVFPAVGLTADEGHVFARDGALVWGDEVRAFLNRWMGATERGSTSRTRPAQRAPRRSRRWRRDPALAFVGQSERHPVPWPPPRVSLNRSRGGPGAMSGRVAAKEGGFPNFPGKHGHRLEEVFEVLPPHEQDFGVGRHDRHGRSPPPAFEEPHLSEDIHLPELSDDSAPDRRHQMAGKQDVEAIGLVPLDDGGLTRREGPDLAEDGEGGELARRHARDHAPFSRGVRFHLQP